MAASGDSTPSPVRNDRAASSTRAEETAAPPPVDGAKEFVAYLLALVATVRAEDRLQELSEAERRGSRNAQDYMDSTDFRAEKTAIRCLMKVFRDRARKVRVLAHSGSLDEPVANMQERLERADQEAKRTFQAAFGFPSQVPATNDDRHSQE